MTFIFKCSNCKHSATDHSSKTGPIDMHCHRDDCSCDYYSNWATQALAQA